MIFTPSSPDASDHGSAASKSSGSKSQSGAQKKDAKANKPKPSKNDTEEFQTSATRIDPLKVARYLEDVRTREGFSKMIDVVGRFRRETSATKIVYGNTLQVLDFSRMNFANFDFQNSNLAMAYMKGVNLMGANLQGADLSHANFEAANLENANFSHTNLGKADFSKANIKGAIFEGANLFKANFTDVDGIPKPDIKKLEQKTLISRQLPRMPLAPVE